MLHLSLEIIINKFLAAETCLRMHYFGNKSPKSPSAGGSASRAPCLRLLDARPLTGILSGCTRRVSKKVYIDFGPALCPNIQYMCSPKDKKIKGLRLLWVEYTVYCAISQSFRSGISGFCSVSVSVSPNAGLLWSRAWVDVPSVTPFSETLAVCLAPRPRLHLMTRNRARFPFPMNVSGWYRCLVILR